MNKRTLLIAALVGLLIVGGAGYAYYAMKMNAPAFRGRAIPVKTLDEELVTQWTEAFEKALQNEDVLQEIVEESGYGSLLDVPDGEAVDHLKEAVRVRFRSRNDSIEVGLVGKRKDDEKLKDIALILYQKAEAKTVEIAPSFQAYLDAVAEARERAQSQSEAPSE